jgi:hypothetical protein
MRKVSSVIASSFRNLVNSALSLGDRMAFCKVINVSLHDTLIFSSCLKCYCITQRYGETKIWKTKKTKVTPFLYQEFLSGKKILVWFKSHPPHQNFIIIFLGSIGFSSIPLFERFVPPQTKKVLLHKVT